MIVIIIWLLLMFYIFFRLAETPEHRQARVEARIARMEAAKKTFGGKVIYYGVLMCIFLMALLGLLIIGIVIAAVIAPDTVNGFFDWLEVRWNMPFRINFPF